MNYTQTITDTSWYRLDNAAKIYPAISTQKNSCVFRIAANLKETVDPDILRQAVLDLRNRFPSMFVRLRRGLFWNYYEPNEKDPIIKKETCLINEHVRMHDNNHYDFTFFYYENRISLETFHSLSDGTGASEFLKAVLYRYLQLKGYPVITEGKVATRFQSVDETEIADGFSKHYKPTKASRSKVSPAFRINGDRLSMNDAHAIINGKMPVEQLYRLAKQNDATITQYIAALLTYSIWLADDSAKTSKRPINISIPVNLRKFFGFHTLRNFALFFYTSFQGNGRQITFEDVLQKIKQDFKEELTLEKLQNNLNANIRTERSVAYFPLVIKKLAIKIANYMMGDRSTTVTLSNVGNIDLPQSVAEHVEDFEFNLPVRHALTNNISVISVNGIMNISFARKIRESEVERIFFSHLAKNGVDVTISGNLAEQFI